MLVDGEDCAEYCSKSHLEPSTFGESEPKTNAPIKGFRTLCELTAGGTICTHYHCANHPVFSDFESWAPAKVMD